MAGDWIKMRCDLHVDPSVFKLAAITNEDRFLVVGRLHAFWSWADKYAVDGRVDGATSHVVDDVVRLPGFADALVAVKWLIVGEDFVSIPKPERHNGESAKERGLKNARQARWRGKKDNLSPTYVDATPSTTPSTREENRREEGKDKRKEGADAHSGEEDAEVPRGTQKQTSGFDPLTLALPDYIPAASWAAWVKHRREIKHSLTPSTAEAQIKKLTRMHTAGHLASDMIQLAIESGWQGLFEPKGAPRAAGMTSAASRDFSKGVGADGRF